MKCIRSTATDEVSTPPLRAMTCACSSGLSPAAMRTIIEETLAGGSGVLVGVKSVPLNIPLWVTLESKPIAV